MTGYAGHRGLPGRWREVHFPSTNTTSCSSFGASSTQLVEDVPWEQGDSVYESSDSRAHVSFAISPTLKDVRIVLTFGGICIYEFNTKGVDDVKHHHEKGRELLEVSVAPGNSAWLSGKPQVAMRKALNRASSVCVRGGCRDGTDILEGRSPLSMDRLVRVKAAELRRSRAHPVQGLLQHPGHPVDPLRLPVIQVITLGWIRRQIVKLSDRRTGRVRVDLSTLGLFRTAVYTLIAGRIGDRNELPVALPDRIVTGAGVMDGKRPNRGRVRVFLTQEAGRSSLRRRWREVWPRSGRQTLP